MRVHRSSSRRGARLVIALLTLAGLACASPPAAPPGPEPPFVLIPGAYLHGANGLAFDAENRLHVASVMSRRIVVVDVEQGRLISELDASRGVQGPDDLAFGPGGTLYWTDALAGEVVRLTSTGLTRSQRLAPGVNAIAFSRTGRLFVALDFYGDGLFELDPALRRPPRPVVPQLGWLNAMTFGPDGAIYGPIWSNGQIVRIDPNNGDVASVARGFAAPAAVRFDREMRLHVGDQQRGEIVRLERDGSWSLIADRMPGLDNFAFDRDNRLFVSNAQDGSVVEIGSGGARRTLLPGGLVGPGGLAVLPGEGADSLFVADLYSLREFDAGSGRVRSTERHVVGARGTVTAPLTVARHGRLLVLSSWLANQVQLFNPDTRRVVLQHDDFRVPLGAIWFAGGLVVAEHGRGSGDARVVWLRDSGREVILGARDGLGIPSGLAASGQALFVSDWFRGRVMRLCLDGEAFAPPTPLIEGLDRPEGLALDRDGRLLIVESGRRRLLAVDPLSSEIQVLAEALGTGLEPPRGAPGPGLIAGVAVDSAGRVFVSGDATNEVYRLDPPSHASSRPRVDPCGAGLSP